MHGFTRSSMVRAGNALLAAVALGLCLAATALADSDAQPIVYVAQTSANAIAIFPQDGPLKPIGMLTTGLKAPQGLWVDQQQNLWVANAGTSVKSDGYILVFKRNATTASRRIDVPAGYGPVKQIWVAASGTVYTVNCPYYSADCSIALRTTSGKWSIINEPDMPTVYGIVGDHAGNLYAAGTSQFANGEIVEKLPNGSSQWQGIGLPFFFGLDQLAIDADGQLVINVSFPGAMVYYDTNRGVLQRAWYCLNCVGVSLSPRPAHDVWTIAPVNEQAWLDDFTPLGTLQKHVVLPANAGAFYIALSPALDP